MKLYELVGTYRAIAEQLEDVGADQQTILDTLAGSTEMISIEEKAAGIVRMAKNWEAELPGLKEEIKRLTDRKKAIENRVDSVKQYLQMNMEVAGIDKLKLDTFTISLQNNPPSVIVDDQTVIPAEFITIVPEQYVPDKKRIAEALKEGREVTGVHLERGRSLRIR